jgi:hypothetical protein
VAVRSIRESRSRWLQAAVLLLAAGTLASADMVKCKKPDGSLYYGPSPPEGCEVTDAVSTTKKQSADPMVNARERRDEIEEEADKLAQTADALLKASATSASLSDITANLALHANDPGLGRAGDRLDKDIRTRRRETLFKLRALYDEWDGLERNSHRGAALRMCT